MLVKGGKGSLVESGVLSVGGAQVASHRNVLVQAPLNVLIPCFFTPSSSEIDLAKGTSWQTF